MSPRSSSRVEFRDFQVEALWRETSVRKRAEDRAFEVAAAELGGRQVHRHTDVVRPTRARLAGAPEHGRAHFLHQPDLLDDRDELGWRHGPKQSAAPARQRFEADDPSRCDGDDGLEIDLDLVGRDRGAQLELDQTADLDLRVHLLFERPPGPAPIGFRGIERDIRFGEQGVGAQPVARRRGAADACADDDLAPVDDHGAVDLVDDALGEVVGLQLTGVVMVKDDEFVAAPARDQVARPDDGAQPVCDLDQELVAGSVSETVVDLLEVIEVEEHHIESGAA